MKDNERRTIRSIIADIRTPKKEKNSTLEAVNLTRIPRGSDFRFYKFFQFLHRFGIVLFVLFILGTIFFLLSFQDTKKMTTATAGIVADNFSASIAALRELRPEKAAISLEENKVNLLALKKTIDTRHSEGLLSVIGIFVPSVRSGLSLFQDVNTLNNSFLSFVGEFSRLKRNGLRYMQTDGGVLIASVERTKILISDLSNNIKNAQNNLSALSPGGAGDFSNDYLRYSTELIRTEKFLSGLTDLLKSSGERHIALIFQNTGVLLPGGGVGQIYADITFEGGKIKNIDVRDAREADAGFSKKFVPPIELRTETRTWGTRDTYWFFDVPTSAKTFISFLENSKLYADKNITFDGVIAINNRAMESLLVQTGPIQLEEQKVSVNQDNFRAVLERRLAISGALTGNDSKKMISIFLPRFLDRISNLNDSEMEKFVDEIFMRMKNRDITIYAKNQDIASFLNDSGADAGMYKLPNGFFGSYLAVASANIGGGTDAYIEQTLNARIDLDTNAGVFTDLTLERTNKANTKESVWRRVPARTFMQIYTNPNSSLVSVKGNDFRPAVSKFDYSKGDYTRVPELDAIESSRTFSSASQLWNINAYGRTAYGLWFSTSPGETKTLELRSQVLASPNTIIEPGKVYTFIFERQPGSPMNLKLVVSAPLGYTFQESGNALYTFEDTTSAGRIVIPLTLAK